MANFELHNTQEVQPHNIPVDALVRRLMDEPEYLEPPEGQPFIPEDWTYLIHGTNQVEWRTVDFTTTPELTVRGSGLSAITREADKKNRETLGKRYDLAGTTAGYANNRACPEGMSHEEFARLSTPLEFRIIFYPPYASRNLVSDRWQSLPLATRDLVYRYYQGNIQAGNHPVVPRGEHLRLLSKVTDNSGRDIYYYIPTGILNDYAIALGAQDGQNSVIMEQ